MILWKDLPQSQLGDDDVKKTQHTLPGPPPILC